MSTITYPSEQFDRWMAAHKAHLVVPPNPLRLLADGAGNTILDTANWPTGEGGPPTLEEVLAVGNVTEIEITFKRVQTKLNADEEKRTGKPVNPDGAVPLTRAMAATAMIVNKWNYPSEADLSAGNNPTILAAIYADPTTRTNADSLVEQKQSVLHFTLVMLAGQAFGLEYQNELGAYERTASKAFQVKLSADKTRDWLKLPCPKMHKDWPEFSSVLGMFQAIMA